MPKNTNMILRDPRTEAVPVDQQQAQLPALQRQLVDTNLDVRGIPMTGLQLGMLIDDHSNPIEQQRANTLLSLHVHAMLGRPPKTYRPLDLGNDMVKRLDLLSTIAPGFVDKKEVELAEQLILFMGRDTLEQYHSNQEFLTAFCNKMRRLFGSVFDGNFKLIKTVGFCVETIQSEFSEADDDQSVADFAVNFLRRLPAFIDQKIQALSRSGEISELNVLLRVLGLAGAPRAFDLLLEAQRGRVANLETIQLRFMAWMMHPEIRGDLKNGFDVGVALMRLDSGVLQILGEQIVATCYKNQSDRIKPNYAAQIATVYAEKFDCLLHQISNNFESNTPTSVLVDWKNVINCIRWMIYWLPKSNCVLDGDGFSIRLSENEVPYNGVMFPKEIHASELSSVQFVLLSLIQGTTEAFNAYISQDELRKKPSAACVHLLRHLIDLTFDQTISWKQAFPRIELEQMNNPVLTDTEVDRLTRELTGHVYSEIFSSSERVDLNALRLRDAGNLDQDSQPGDAPGPLVPRS